MLVRTDIKLGAIRGQTGLEMDLRLDVLTEIREPETIQPHATDSSPVGPATRSASRR